MGRSDLSICSTFTHASWLSLPAHTHEVTHLIVQDFIEVHPDFYCLELQNILEGRPRGTALSQRATAIQLVTPTRAQAGVKSPHHTQPPCTALKNCDLAQSRFLDVHFSYVHKT